MIQAARSSRLWIYFWGPGRRVNYNFEASPKKMNNPRFSRDESAPSRVASRDRHAPWGSATTSRNQKTPEEIEEEERQKAEREAAAKQQKAERVTHVE